MVAYRAAAPGGSTATTLELNGLGAIPIKRNGMNYDLNYYYGKGSVLFLVYGKVDGVPCWQITDVWWTDTDRKTSANPTTDTKLYLVGSKSVSNGGVATYVNTGCYVGEDNHLYSAGEKVLTLQSLPEDVPAYVRQEADRLAAVVQSRQNAHTVSLMLGADLHARVGLTGEINSDQMLQTTLHAAQAMKILSDRVHLDAVGLLGSSPVGVVGSAGFAQAASANTIMKTSNNAKILFIVFRSFSFLILYIG
jgi:hypothetical protein